MDDKESHVLTASVKLSASDVALTPHPNPRPCRNVWRRMDWYILPAACTIFFLSFLDKGNIGNARVAGLQKELRMTDHQYSIALTVTYIPYILIELPSNLLMKRIGGNIMLPAMALLWGIVTTLQGLVTSYSGLIACRFFMGLFEGGLLPGLALYLSSFYPRQQLQIRISAFFVMTSLAGAFSGLLAAAIVKMEGVGGLHGWAWIFILEGLVTVLVGLASFWILPRDVFSAKFLSYEERAHVQQVLREDGVIAYEPRGDKFRWKHVWATLRRPHVWFMIVAGFFNGTTLLGLTYFTPTIISSLGYIGNRAQLMGVPPFALSFLLSLLTSYYSDRYAQRGLTLGFFALLSTAGFALFLGSGNDTVRYAALFLVFPGTYAAAPPLAAWVANNAAPAPARAAALALLTVSTNSGGVLATWLLAAPKWSMAGTVLLVFQVGIVVCAGANWGWLAWANRGKAMKRGVVPKEEEGEGEDSVWFEYNL